MTSSSYTIDISPSAQRDIRRLDAAVAARIAAALRSLAQNPRPDGCRKLRGSSGIWRVAVGDWRALYTINDTTLTILVVRVRHRREVYR